MSASGSAEIAVIESGDEASGAEMRDVGLETGVVSAAMLKNSYSQSPRSEKEQRNGLWLWSE